MLAPPQHYEPSNYTRVTLVKSRVAVNALVRCEPREIGKPQRVIDMHERINRNRLMNATDCPRRPRPTGYFRTAAAIGICLVALRGFAADGETSKHLRLFVDLPGDGRSGSIFTGNLVRRDFGHVFVELLDTGTGHTTGRLGFYPKNGVFPPFESLDHGELRKDYRRAYDVWKEYPLSDRQYAAALQFIEASTNEPPRFDLDHYNCVDWALDVLERAGQELAVETRDVGLGSGAGNPLNTKPLWRGLCPAALGDALIKAGGLPGAP